MQSKLYFIQLPWLLTRCKIFSATLKSGYFGNFDSRSQNQQGFKIRRNRARKKSPTKIDQQVTTVSKMVSFTKVQFFYEIYRLFLLRILNQTETTITFGWNFPKWANLQSKQLSLLKRNPSRTILRGKSFHFLNLLSFANM